MNARWIQGDAVSLSACIDILNKLMSTVRPRCSTCSASGLIFRYVLIEINWCLTCRVLGFLGDGDVFVCSVINFERAFLSYCHLFPHTSFPWVSSYLPSFIIYLTSPPLVHTCLCALFIFTRTYTAGMTYCQQLRVDLYYSISPPVVGQSGSAPACQINMDLRRRLIMKTVIFFFFFFYTSIASNIVFSFVSGTCSVGES